MPRAAKVSVDEALNAICQFPKDLMTCSLPHYTSEFYENVSNVLNGQWSAHSIYTNLRENRRNLRTL